VSVKGFNKEQRYWGTGIRTAFAQGRKVRRDPGYLGTRKAASRTFLFSSSFHPPLPQPGKRTQPSNQPPKPTPPTTLKQLAFWLAESGLVCRGRRALL